MECRKISVEFLVNEEQYKKLQEIAEYYAIEHQEIINISPEFILASIMQIGSAHIIDRELNEELEYIRRKN